PATASSPSAASPTTSTSGWSSRNIRRPCRTTAWSSAIRTRIGIGASGDLFEAPELDVFAGGLGREDPSVHRDVRPGLEHLDGAEREADVEEGVAVAQPRRLDRAGEDDHLVGHLL